ncbi:hypothetical protein MAR_016147 [Mya arenaria]|uniref:Uncharacterized protein n=1 Tax=Mya arenaria TaxID=6604 RepID=A0ABY7FIZ9_MYAAR|nr:hypothetical protein MAR_016147 [Mya arenaria]
MSPSRHQESTKSGHNTWFLEEPALLTEVRLESNLLFHSDIQHHQKRELESCNGKSIPHSAKGQQKAGRRCEKTLQ